MAFIAAVVISGSKFWVSSHLWGPVQLLAVTIEREDAKHIKECKGNNFAGLPGCHELT